MYQLRIHRSFVAKHALRLYDQTMETMHQHDWQVHIHVQADQLDEIEVVIDFHLLETVADQAIAPLKNQTLNDLPCFNQINPSAERVAEYLYNQITPQLPSPVQLQAVSVMEATNCWATYTLQSCYTD